MHRIVLPENAPVRHHRQRNVLGSFFRRAVLGAHLLIEFVFLLLGRAEFCELELALLHNINELDRLPLLIYLLIQQISLLLQRLLQSHESILPP